MLMGIKKLPSYLSSRHELRDEYISSVMPRDRFSWLLGNFHVNDNERQKGDKNFDKLYKSRHLLDKLSETFISAMRPHENQAIDESIIRFKGWSSIRQYLLLKPIKRGYTVWIRADFSGYVCYHYKVFFDNYFNSVMLQRSLLADRCYACGAAICFYFLDVAVVNSFIPFQDRFLSKMTLKEFRPNVSTELIGAQSNIPKRARKSAEKSTKKFKTIIPQGTAKMRIRMSVRTTSLRCAHCSTKKEPRRTQWKCRLLSQQKKELLQGLPHNICNHIPPQETTIFPRQGQC
ncbi:hypothetical protein ILUMI_02840 [Ignelater luminosus]|uniref:PiggyBac transposable element-derived protein domain-containing protein n=1 Tax=Ignelater luminosus TaxID=2038154 RepID=A0A8K0GKH4_IGNLU|nr:hypothetical protein ILUMI_02840 [Ignelater luminosus]